MGVALGQGMVRSRSAVVPRGGLRLGTKRKEVVKEV